MLIIFGGLPGTGKTTIARELALQLDATYSCIDSMEQALHDSTADAPPAGLLKHPHLLARRIVRLLLRNDRKPTSEWQPRQQHQVQTTEGRDAHPESTRSVNH
jgi:thymidylate kinase